MQRRIAPSIKIEEAIEEEMEAFLGRARYERTPEATGSRVWTRPRRVQTAEGEITVAMPQERGSLTRFVSSNIPDTKAIVRTTTGHVKRRRDGTMKKRWVGAGTLEVERSFRRAKGCGEMPVPVAALRRHAAGLPPTTYHEEAA